MIYIFFAALALSGMLYMMSRGKYDQILYPLSKKEYSLKDFMPVALFILDRIRYRYSSGYDQSLQLKLGELYQQENARYYLKIHWANKLALMMIMLLIIVFLAAAVGNPDGAFAFFAVVSLALAFYLTDNELNEKVKKRRFMIQIDFPDFLNKLILLVNAGMTISSAMEKIVLDRQEVVENQDRPLYKELQRMMQEIKAGVPEVKAYEDLAKRCKIPEISKFTSVIIQNLRKGNAELVSILRLQAVECWDMRKNVARRLGEEASTKLLFPMMIMLLAILIIVVTPVAMQLQGF